jgi:hypothetical protein
MQISTQYKKAGCRDMQGTTKERRLATDSYGWIKGTATTFHTYRKRLLMDSHGQIKGLPTDFHQRYKKRESRDC